MKGIVSCHRPLAGGVRTQGELGFDQCRSPERLVIKDVELVPDSTVSIIRVDGRHVLFCLRTCVNPVDIRLNQAGINSKSMAPDQTF